MRVIVFDLDDTLYEARSFYESGDLAVSELMQKKWGIPVEESYRRMLELLDKNGGNKLFGQVLKKYGVYSKRAEKECVSLLRLHSNPKISLYPDASRCFKRFKSWPKYIVTDGNKLVQQSKIQALKLEGNVKKVFITHRHGVKFAKPSPYCLLKIARLEKVIPEQVVYIGDNPNKDFVGIKPLGFKTIRVLRGFHKMTKLKSSHEAHRAVGSLDEIDEKMLNSLNEKL